ncbi:hypothetical protein FNH05_11360 [Amycolatopsis rhizosphaerae]|uniref:Uncharacterized protein n=1 Tax=Amycolatopsis rhizosphaerae TaxID=2053003 RepID=A0A558CYE1_9PSEU|nr:hypothetical protein [Amycolatopsis rhizosphaerae]TVT53777.1 hypothetical protein FNH05_11360 [Amycolatopsis rhizosphaerae]
MPEEPLFHAAPEDRLDAALRQGTHRERVHDQFELSASPSVQGSPHLFLADGRNLRNPGIRFRWSAP